MAGGGSALADPVSQAVLNHSLTTVLCVPLVSDYHELCMAGGGSALADPVAQAVLNYISSDQPADYHLTVSRRAPAFVIISAPYTGEYLHHTYPVFSFSCETFRKVDTLSCASFIKIDCYGASRC